MVALEEASRKIAEQHGTFDPRSERNLSTLQPKAQPAARAFRHRLRNAAIDARILSGTRTYAEQEALFRKGRFGNQEKRVTNARGGQSNHNFGIAWDIGIFEEGTYVKRVAPYKAAAEKALVAGLDPALEWGGHWESFPDPPHFQLAVGQPVALVRRAFESGTAFV